MITDRKNVKCYDGPEERYIGFVTNPPPHSQDRGLYQKMWNRDRNGKIEECRAKRWIPDMESRMLCFYYSQVLYNGRIIIRAVFSDGTERQSAMTMFTFKVQLESLLICKSKPPA